MSQLTAAEQWASNGLTEAGQSVVHAPSGHVLLPLTELA